MRLAFVAVQLLDGIATTTDNVRGLLPDILELAGFEKVETTNSYSTLLGTLSLTGQVSPLLVWLDLLQLGSNDE